MNKEVFCATEKPHRTSGSRHFEGAQEKL